MNSLVINTTVQVYSIEECDESTKELIEQAKTSTSTSYAPYSNFKVGAAVLLKSGRIVTGTNQENAAYPSGLCAERTALFYANSQYPDDSVIAIAIAAYYNNDFTEEVCSPCGSCRQVLVEIENRYGNPARIIMCSKKHIYEVSSITELLPLCFGKDHLL